MPKIFEALFERFGEKLPREGWPKRWLKTITRGVFKAFSLVGQVIDLMLGGELVESKAILFPVYLMLVVFGLVLTFVYGFSWSFLLLSLVVPFLVISATTWLLLAVFWLMIGMHVISSYTHSLFEEIIAWSEYGQRKRKKKRYTLESETRLSDGEPAEDDEYSHEVYLRLSK